MTGKVLEDQDTLNCWEGIVDKSIPMKYEYRTKIVHLWVVMRGHSFAKTWTMQFERKNYKKSTRKTLNPEEKKE